MRLKKFRDGIGCQFFWESHGRALRWLRCPPGLIGLRLHNQGLHLGLWWQVRFEVVWVHRVQFEQPTKE